MSVFGLQKTGSASDSAIPSGSAYYLLYRKSSSLRITYDCRGCEAHVKKGKMRSRLLCRYLQPSPLHKIQRRHLHFNDSTAMQEGKTPRDLDSEFSPLDLSAGLQETHVTALEAEEPAI